MPAEQSPKPTVDATPIASLRHGHVQLLATIPHERNRLAERNSYQYGNLCLGGSFGSCFVFCGRDVLQQDSVPLILRKMRGALLKGGGRSNGTLESGGLTTMQCHVWSASACARCT
eukprot:3240287-Amphidinium_carterae.1